MKRILPLLTALLFAACGSNTGTTVSKEELTFPFGNQLPSPPFTGEAYLLSMIQPDTVFNFPATNNITFAPGSRFAHLAANTNPDKPGVEWFDLLSEEEYNKLPKE